MFKIHLLGPDGRLTKISFFRSSQNSIGLLGSIGHRAAISIVIPARKNDGFRQQSVDAEWRAVDFPISLFLSPLAGRCTNAQLA
jgi:hypothetical protein